MCIDTRVSRRSRQILVLLVWDMKMSAWIPILFRQPKINNIDLVSALAQSHQEIIRLDVAMEKVFRVDVFNAGDELISQEQD